MGLYQVADDEWVDGDGRHLWRIHSEERCAGEHCCVHNPSDHPMQNFPLVLSLEERFLMLRRCSHGKYHPDPDSAEYVISMRVRMYQDSDLEFDKQEIEADVRDHSCCELECCKHPYPRTWIHR